MDLPIRTDDARRVTVVPPTPPPTTCTVWTVKSAEPHFAFDPIKKRWSVFLREGEIFTKIMEFSSDGNIAMVPSGELTPEFTSVVMNLQTSQKETFLF